MKKAVLPGKKDLKKVTAIRLFLPSNPSISASASKKKESSYSSKYQLWAKFQSYQNWICLSWVGCMNLHIALLVYVWGNPKCSFIPSTIDIFSNFILKGLGPKIRLCTIYDVINTILCVNQVKSHVRNLRVWPIKFEEILSMEGVTFILNSWDDQLVGSTWRFI